MVRIGGYTELRGWDDRLVLARHDGAGGGEVLLRYVAGELRDRARRQVAVLSTVESQYLVRVREFVEEEHGAAVVLDAPRAVPLPALLAHGRVVTPEAALYLLRGSLCGLAAVHAAGVAHSGYRPDAVLVDLAGQVRLVDFGLEPPPGYASAVADVHAAVAAFVVFLTADTTFTAPADLIAATPVTLRELVRAGLSRDVDMVALLASLDEVATAQFGGAWAERGRLWLAVGARELRVAELAGPGRGGRDSGLLAIERQRL
ncbi:MAG TPA: hypothetical protein VJT31_41415, partial [Rugosimonospora sp.]|nr:hypothetical protein [Rugosimonospora sp.]